MNPLYALPSMLSSDFTSDFWFYDFYHISCSYPALTIILYHTSLLLLSYHTMSIPAWYYLLYLSTCFCVPVLTTWFSMHDYDSVLSIHVCLSLHAIWLSPHHSPGNSDSSGSSCPGPGAWSMLELGACRFSQLLTWIPVADLKSTAIAWISSGPSEALSFQAPLRVSRVFLL